MAPEPQTVATGGTEGHSAFPPARRNKLIGAKGPLKNLLFMFVLLGAIAFGANLELLLHVNSEIQAIAEAKKPDPAMAAGGASEVIQALKGVRIRIAVVLGVTVVCVGLILAVIALKIIAPIRTVTEALRQICKGDLSITVPTNPHVGLSELGQGINDLAANYQEILLLAGTVAGSSRRTLETMERALESEPEKPAMELIGQIRQVKEELDMLGSIVQEFRFYHARFDGRAVVGEMSPGTESEAGRSGAAPETSPKDNDLEDRIGAQSAERNKA